MKSTIRIKNVAVYHPQNEIGNEFFIHHFDKQGKDVRRMLEAFGRNTRYISNDPKENSLTMAIEATKSVLQRSDLQGKDIDLIIFTSGTPEFVAPTNAIHIHQAIEGKSTALAFDMNANCVGMILAFEQAVISMRNNPAMNRAIIVGSEQMNRYSPDTNELIYPTFGDAACAVILEKVNAENDLFDSFTYTDSSGSHVMAFPAHGLSTLYDGSMSEIENKIYWATDNDGSRGFLVASKSIELLLQRNNLKKEDIKGYFVSQMSKRNIEKIAHELKEDVGKFPFIGDRFGYTGTSSPFIALHESIEKKLIKRGDPIVFWSIGVGFVSSSVICIF